MKLAVTHYFALIRKDNGSCYGVDFPDFPGCISAGDTVEEARIQAKAALDMHVDGMLEDGYRLPVASRLDDILDNPENRESLVLAIEVPLMGALVS